MEIKIVDYNVEGKHNHNSEEFKEQFHAFQGFWIKFALVPYLWETEET